MTDLKKPITRRTMLPHRGRRLVVTLLPGDTIGLRMLRHKRTEYISIGAVYDMAVKMRVYSEKMAKKGKK